MKFKNKKDVIFYFGCIFLVIATMVLGILAMLGIIPSGHQK